ncbi:hypothetical protein [Streptomyces sp. NPDC093589]|uniref:hypothetical protein n=1 Tax=Streptomyces sp. NPDC093589 TaxID=3366043 RepID=UPI00382A5D6A
MPYLQTPPSVIEVVTDEFRTHRRSFGGRYAMEHLTVRKTVGEFTAVAGATVEVQVLVHFSKKRPTYSQPEERVVQFGAAVKCHGHGCTEPKHQVSSTPDTLWDDAEDLTTAEAALPGVQQANAWAQAHAEKCRARPYTDR